MEHPEEEGAAKNEIRVTKLRNFGKTLRYVHTILEKDKSHDFIVMRGAGPAIANVVPLADLIRRRIPGLHMLTEITTLSTEVDVKGEK